MELVCTFKLTIHLHRRDSSVV